MGRFNEIIQEKGLAHIGSSRLVPSLFPCYELEMKTGKRREVSQNEVGSPKMSEAFSSSTLHDARYPVSTKASPPSPVVPLLSARGRKGARSLAGSFR